MHRGALYLLLCFLRILWRWICNIEVIIVYFDIKSGEWRGWACVFSQRRHLTLRFNLLISRYLRTKTLKLSLGKKHILVLFKNIWFKFIGNWRIVIRTFSHKFNFRLSENRVRLIVDERLELLFLFLELCYQHFTVINHLIDWSDISREIKRGFS